MEASIVIPTYNKAMYLELTLESLWHQNYDKSSFEVIIADDDSTDKTCEVIQQFSARDWHLRHLKLPHKERSATRNAGIREAHGRVIIFIDDDCICCRDLIANHMALHQEGTPKAVIGLRHAILTRLPQAYAHKIYTQIITEITAPLMDSTVVPLLVNHIVTDPFQSFNLISVADVARNFDKIEALSAVEDVGLLKLLSGVAASQCFCPWLYFLTSNASVDRNTLFDVGLFDESFKGWGEEDLELAFRLYRAGVPFDALPETIVYNQIHLRDPQQNKKWWRNYIRFVEKHQHPVLHLRSKLIHSMITREEFEATAARIEAGLLEASELQELKDWYNQSIGRG